MKKPLVCTCSKTRYIRRVCAVCRNARRAEKTRK